MKTPRDVSGPELLKALRVLGYERIQQDGSHIRLTTGWTASSTSRFPLIIRSRLQLCVVYPEKPHAA